MAKAVFRSGDHIMIVTLPNGKINIPGGHLDFGESPLDTLRRELKEEISYALSAEPQLIGVWSTVRSSEPVRLLIGYLIDLPEQRPFTYTEPAEPGGICTWIDRNAIETMAMPAYYKEFLTAAFNHPHGTLRLDRHLSS